MEKTEELRQNWHITEMQHNWKVRRMMAKKKANEAIAKANAEKEEKIKCIREQFDAQQRALNDALNEELLTIAREKDEYMHRFRNYVASLPKDEQAAYDMHRE